jgi:hypothetical protein
VVEEKKLRLKLTKVGFGPVAFVGVFASNRIGRSSKRDLVF